MVTEWSIQAPRGLAQKMAAAPDLLAALESIALPIYTWAIAKVAVIRLPFMTINAADASEKLPAPPLPRPIEKPMTQPAINPDAFSPIEEAVGKFREEISHWRGRAEDAEAALGHW